DLRGYQYLPGPASLRPPPILLRGGEG
ncbi:Hypothetical predicted protein, partial [Cloeon dipterum]